MTARMLATLALALGLTFAGCSTGKDTTADTDTDAGTGDDDDDDAVETAPTGTSDDGFFVPAAVQPYAYFGFDLTSGTLVEVTTSYGAVTPSIEVAIGNEDWEASGLDYSRTDLYCVAQLPLTDSTFASWAQTEGLYYGVDYVGPDVLTSCTEANGFIVDGYGDGEIATAFAGAWGVGVGELTATGADSLAGYTYSGVPEGSFFGGWFNDPLLGRVVADQLALAGEVDPSFAVTGNYLQASAVNPGNGISTGFYEVLALYYVYFY